MVGSSAVCWFDFQNPPRLRSSEPRGSWLLRQAQPYNDRWRRKHFSMDADDFVLSLVAFCDVTEDVAFLGNGVGDKRTPLDVFGAVMNLEDDFNHLLSPPNHTGHV
jgi:hypothetical protein